MSEKDGGGASKVGQPYDQESRREEQVFCSKSPTQRRGEEECRF